MRVCVANSFTAASCCRFVLTYSYPTPNTTKAMTVSPSSKVWVRALDTLSSTNATPTERSVIDSKRLTLITARQLLSAPVQRLWPSQARSRACTRGRTREHPRESCEMDQTSRPVFRTGSPGNPRDLLISSLRPKPELTAPQNCRLRPWLDRSPSFFEFRGRGCPTRCRE